MADRCNADLPQILRCELREDPPSRSRYRGRLAHSAQGPIPVATPLRPCGDPRPEERVPLVDDLRPAPVELPAAASHLAAVSDAHGSFQVRRSKIGNIGNVPFPPNSAATSAQDGAYLLQRR